MDTSFCLDAVEGALRKGRPKIFNTDQGAQFTSAAFADKLEATGVRISMDGRGRRCAWTTLARRLQLHRANDSKTWPGARGNLRNITTELQRLPVALIGE